MSPDPAQGQGLPNTSTSINPFDVFDLYRKYVEHENELIHQRLGSMAAVQAFLIAGFGVAFQKRGELQTESLKTGAAAIKAADRASAVRCQSTKNTKAHRLCEEKVSGFNNDASAGLIIQRSVTDQISRYDFLLAGTCTSGILIAAVATVSVFAARNAIRNLDRRFSNHVEKWNRSTPVDKRVRYLPRLTGGGYPRATTRGSHQSLAVPLFITLLWIVALVITLNGLV